MHTLVVAIVCLALGALYHAYITQQLVKLDKWVNWKLLGGIEGETISSRAGRAVERVRAGQAESGDEVWCILCKILDVFQKDHCIKNIQLVPGVPND